MKRLKPDDFRMNDFYHPIYDIITLALFKRFIRFVKFFIRIVFL